ncbi:MAG: hypothetical protein ACREUG_09240 [Steroidobacteraceae bacterium]
MSSTAPLVPTRYKRADEELSYFFDWREELRAWWCAGQDYSAGAFMRLRGSPGFAYQGQADGESGAIEPAGALVLGQTIRDGSMLWTAMAASAGGTDPIASASWSLIAPADAALLIVPTFNTAELSYATFSGGTSGQSYTVACVIVTASGDEFDQRFTVSVL